MIKIMYACMYVHVCRHVYVCMHAYTHTGDRGFFLKNPVLSTLPFSRTVIRCGTYPMIVNNKSVVASLFHVFKYTSNIVFFTFVTTVKPCRFRSSIELALHSAPKFTCRTAANCFPEARHFVK